VVELRKERELPELVKKKDESDQPESRKDIERGNIDVK